MYFVVKKVDKNLQGTFNFQIFDNCGKVFTNIKANWLYIWWTLYVDKTYCDDFNIVEQAEITKV